MKKSRFSETQIVSILKEADAGLPVKNVCRKHGISDATYYKWKSKYGGMEAADLKARKGTGSRKCLASSACMRSLRLKTRRCRTWIPEKL
jgi:putative transposase